VYKSFDFFPITIYYRFLRRRKLHYLPFHNTLKFEKISSLGDTLSNGLILPVCYGAVNNVWESLGAVLQATRCHPRTTAKGLVNWTSTTSPSWTPAFIISGELVSL